MQFEERRQRRNIGNPTGEQNDIGKRAARPPPDRCQESNSGNETRGLRDDLIVPPDVMVLIKRVAKYHARVHDGLIRTAGDMEKAIHFARQGPEGMTEEEHEEALAIIESNCEWDALLDRLSDAASDDVDSHA